MRYNAQNYIETNFHLTKVKRQTLNSDKAYKPMTIKTFWKDPYLTELETSITSVNEDCITLAETIFYAFSGGQESDAGSIGTYPVLKAEKKSTEIYYTLPKGHTLKTGDAVQVIIDWHRRYQLMRLHFAAEIVLELVSQQCPNIIKVGAHISQNKARIDFKWDRPISPLLHLIEQEAQNIIDAQLPILSAFSDETSERRYWKIDGFAQVPCGGTHIKNTEEVGIIQLKRANPGKGQERIEIFVKDRPQIAGG